MIEPLTNATHALQGRQLGLRAFQRRGVRAIHGPLLADCAPMVDWALLADWASPHHLHLVHAGPLPVLDADAHALLLRRRNGNSAACRDLRLINLSTLAAGNIDRERSARQRVVVSRSLL